MEHQKEMKEINEKRMEDERKIKEENEKTRNFYEQMAKNEKKIYDMELKYLNEKEREQKRHYEQLQKLSKDLTEKNKQIIIMKLNNKIKYYH